MACNSTPFESVSNYIFWPQLTPSMNHLWHMLIWSFSYPENTIGSDGGSYFYWDLAGYHLSETNSLTLKYDVLFHESFDWVKGGKLPGLYGGKHGCSGGADAAELECFSGSNILFLTSYSHNPIKIWRRFSTLWTRLWLFISSNMTPESADRMGHIRTELYLFRKGRVMDHFDILYDPSGAQRGHITRNIFFIFGG